MSEEREVINRELLGNPVKPCVLCGLSKPQSELILVTSEVIGHAGGGNVDICIDCYQRIQRDGIEPEGDPEM